jgi:RimJ/RimL family protein N-acetyltransferase
MFECEGALHLEDDSLIMDSYDVPPRMMLQGALVNLRVAEIEDIPQLAKWFSDPGFAGDYQHFPIQVPEAHLEKRIREHELYHSEWVDFVVEDKLGAKVGWAAHYNSAPNFGWTEIGFAIAPPERNRGYASEAAAILTDYLFLTRDIGRIQAVVDTENTFSVKALEKYGFKREGALRKSLWSRKGAWADGYLYGIVREEWCAPRVLTRDDGADR